MRGLKSRRTNNLGKALIALFVFISLPGLVHAQVSVASPPTTDYVGFSPSNGALNVVLGAIGSAKSTLRIACYEFTSREIARAVLDAAGRGVDVEIVADWKASEQRYSEIPYLARHGIAVHLDGRYAIMHDKFMVIDGTSVETGSFNYTLAAVRENAENALFIPNDQAIAAPFAQEWTRLWDESTPLR